MITKNALIEELKSSQTFFKRSTEVLTEEHANFAPVPSAMTVAQQIAHTAATIEWFVQGAYSAEGFDLNFEEHSKHYKSVTKLSAAREWIAKAFALAIAQAEKSSEAELQAKIVPGPIMGGEPRVSAFLGIIEHTAHHRGALTVYSRLLGLTPRMPYL